MILFRLLLILAIISLSAANGGKGKSKDNIMDKKGKSDGEKSSKSSKRSKSSKSSKASSSSDDTASPTAPPTASPTAPPTPTKNLIHFTSGDIELDPCIERREIIAEELGGNLDAPFIDVKEPYLSSSEVSALKAFSDKELKKSLAEGITTDHKGRSLTEDFMISVSASDFLNMVNVDTAREMYKAFKEFNPRFPASRIGLRRTNLTGEKHIRYHVDGPSTVMHVWLNDADDLDGGLYLFLARNGTVKIENTPGAAIIHGDEIVHGVASFTGVRYTLLYVGDTTSSEDILASSLGLEDSRVHTEL